MKDWISDWKRWSRAERCFAIALVILSLVIPLGFMMSGRMIGTKGKQRDYIVGTASAGPIADNADDPAWKKFVADYQAAYKDGVLEIRVPVRAPAAKAAPRKIPVDAG